MGMASTIFCLRCVDCPWDAALYFRIYLILVQVHNGHDACIERACRPVVDYEGYAAEARERCKHADERTVLEAINKLSVSPITHR